MRQRRKVLERLRRSKPFSTKKGRWTMEWNSAEVRKKNPERLE